MGSSGLGSFMRLWSRCWPGYSDLQAWLENVNFVCVYTMLKAVYLFIPKWELFLLQE